MEELAGTVLAGESFEPLSGRVVAAVGLSLDEAVVPPDSLKHRRLQAASRDELVTAMRRTLSHMRRTGTVSCLDFREFGVEGARALRDAAAPLDIDPFIFGSDDPAVLDAADGYGASGANDADFTDERAACTARDAPFAIHAGEPNDSDIHPALDLEPDLLVHMVHADGTHLDRVADHRGLPAGQRRPRRGPSADRCPARAHDGRNRDG